MSKLSLTKNVILLTIIFMFTFNNLSKSNYDKVFFDFQIKDLDGETLDLSKYKNISKQMDYYKKSPIIPCITKLLKYSKC